MSGTVIHFRRRSAAPAVKQQALAKILVLPVIRIEHYEHVVDAYDRAMTQVHDAMAEDRR